MYEHTDSYKNTNSLSYFPIVGLILMLIVSAVFAICVLAEFVMPVSSSLTDDYGNDLSLWTILIGLAAIGRFPIFIFTVVSFLIWLNKSYKNLPALRSEDGEFTSGWAVGWWFIPLANLVKPFQVVRELWNRSDPEFEPEFGFLSNVFQTPNYMIIWWACWIIGNITLNIGDNAFETRYQENIPILLGFFGISGIVTSVAAYMAIRIIREVVTRQRLRYQNLINLNQMNYVPPPPPTFNQ